MVVFAMTDDSSQDSMCVGRQETGVQFDGRRNNISIIFNDV